MGDKRKPVIDTIYVDMDGVLADFCGGASKYFKQPNPWEQDFEQWKGRIFAIPEAWGIPLDDFWAKLERSRSFWRELPVLPGAMKIVNRAIDAVGSNNVHVLSSHGGLRKCLDGKMDWLKKHFPVLHDLKNFHFSVKKWHFTSRTCLLIDDQDDNVEAFRRPPSCFRAGGHSILVPRAWNQDHELRHTAISTVLDLMENYDYQKADLFT